MEKRGFAGDFSTVVGVQIPPPAPSTLFWMNLRRVKLLWFFEDFGVFEVARARVNIGRIVYED
jgi:hypothetical protein